MHRREAAGRRFNTPSEYIRLLIRDDQDLAGDKELEVMIRRAVLASTREHYQRTPSNRWHGRGSRLRGVGETDMTTETKPFEILVAEDSGGNAELVRQCLQQRHINCRLHIVSDGTRAIEFVNRIETAGHQTTQGGAV